MSAEFRQRADFLGTQVITRDAGRKLGVVSQLWVDIDRQEVVALSLRQNLFYGTPQPMMLDSIRQIGDVILVDDENVIEDIDVERYTSLINCEVITETGEMLGKVRGYKFDIDSGKVETLVIASLGFPLIPDQVVSTFELGMNEVVSSVPDRLIVYEGCEERLTQVTVGVLERIGLGKAPWDREDEYAPPAPIRTENQLPSGQQEPLQPPAMRRPQRVEEPIEETWDEDNWEREPVEVRQTQPPQKARLYRDEDEEDNWSNASTSAVPNTIDDRYEDEEELVNFEAVTEVAKHAAAKSDRFSVVEVQEVASQESDPWTEEDGQSEPVIVDETMEAAADAAVEVAAVETPIAEQPVSEQPEADRPPLNIPQKVQEPEDA